MIIFWILLTFVFVAGIYAYIRTKKYPLMKGHQIFSLIQLPLFMFSLKSLKVLNKLQRLALTKKSVVGDVSRKNVKISGFNKEEIQISIFEPLNLKNNGSAPCLIYFHGGGYVLYENNAHYILCCALAKKVKCRVFFVHYRLATTHPFPTPVEDCYCALLHINNNAALYNVDPSKIAVAGDSAGGALSAAVCLMTRDRHGPKICYQLLIYPGLGSPTETKSMATFVDSPFINSRTVKIFATLHLRDGDFGQIQYAKPLCAANFVDLPGAYIEVEEFDCLRDDGIEYGKKLRDCGIDVEEHYVLGGYHGSDVFVTSAHVQKMIEIRARALRKAFGEENLGT